MEMRQIKKLGGRVSIPRFRRRVHLYNRRTGRYFWSVLLFSGGQGSHSEPSSIAAAGFVFCCVRRKRGIKRFGVLPSVTIRHLQGRMVKNPWNKCEQLENQSTFYLSQIPFLPYFLPLCAVSSFFSQQLVFQFGVRVSHFKGGGFHITRPHSHDIGNS